MKSSFKFYIWLILFATTARSGFTSDFDCKQKFETLNDQFNENYGVDNLTAIQLAQEQLELAKSCVDDSLFVYASTNLAWIYLVVSDYNNALPHAQNAYMVAEEMNHQEMLFESLNIKGEIFIELEDYEYALKYYSEGMEMAEKHQDSIQMSIFCKNTALVYDYQDNFDQALKYYLKSLLIHKGLEEEQEIALSYVNIGDLYLTHKKSNLAKRYQEMALEILRDSDQGYYLYTLYLGIADRELQRRNYENVLPYLDSAVNTGLYTLGKADWVNYYEVMADYYALKSDFENAYLVQKNFR